MREVFVPSFLDRRPYNVWEEQQDGARQWALAKARQILETHQPQGLEPGLSVELGRMIAGLEGG
jgi:trimethylamine:corrinoid methyltransferase-like protein